MYMHRLFPPDSTTVISPVKADCMGIECLSDSYPKIGWGTLVRRIQIKTFKFTNLASQRACLVSCILLNLPQRLKRQIRLLASPEIIVCWGRFCTTHCAEGTLRRMSYE